MLIGDNKRIYRISAKLTPGEVSAIKHYIIGAVDTFCNNNKVNEEYSDYFCVYNIFGGENYYWKDPNLKVYQYYIDKGFDQKTARLRAAIDIGRLLQRILEDDNRQFEVSAKQRRFKVKSYRCKYQ